MLGFFFFLEARIFLLTLVGYYEKKEVRLCNNKQDHILIRGMKYKR
jgi:hypothetical protein